MDTGEVRDRLHNACGDHCRDARAISGCDCAAIEDAYDAQAKRIAELEKDRNDWKSVAELNSEAGRSFLARQRVAEAEVTRLREALETAEAFILIAVPDRKEAVEILPGIRAALARAKGESAE